MYHLVTDKLAVSAGSIVFVDDRQANVAAAQVQDGMPTCVTQMRHVQS